MVFKMVCVCVLSSCDAEDAVCNVWLPCFVMLKMLCIVWLPFFCDAEDAVCIVSLPFFFFFFFL